MQLWTPFPPSVNSWKTPVKRGKFLAAILTKQGRVYRERAVEVLQQQWGDRETITTPVSLHLVLFPPCRRVRDLSNYLKATEDALEHAGVVENDSLIHKGVQVWGERIGKPGLALLTLTHFDEPRLDFTASLKGTVPEHLLRK